MEVLCFFNEILTKFMLIIIIKNGSSSWNANMDIQIVLDMFGLITYVTDYWAKADEGINQQLTGFRLSIDTGGNLT